MLVTQPSTDFCIKFDFPEGLFCCDLIYTFDYTRLCLGFYARKNGAGVFVFVGILLDRVIALPLNGTPCRSDIVVSTAKNVGVTKIVGEYKRWVYD